MTKEEKARTPCMFYAFGSCKAAKCDFLQDDSNKYTGPPPRSLAAAKADAKAKPKPKPRPKATASIAPLISAMPAATAQDKVTWIDISLASRPSITRRLHVCAVLTHLLALLPVVGLVRVTRLCLLRVVVSFRRTNKCMS